MTNSRSATTASPGRRRAVRSDARANRERVLASAEEVFAEFGPTASLDVIAKHAGVGSATVYRHFHNRDELLATVLEQRLDSVERYLEELGSVDDAWSALVAYTRWLTDSHEPRLYFALLRPPEGTPTGMQRRRQIRDSVEGLIEQAQAEGMLRRPYEVGDHNAFLYAHLRLASEPDVAHETIERLLDIYFEGLRAR